MNNYEFDFTSMSLFFVNKDFNLKMSFDHVKRILKPHVKDIFIFMREFLDYYHVKLV